MPVDLEALRPAVLDIFAHLHAHPELSWREARTTAYIQEFLQEHGCRTRVFEDCTGVIGEIGEGSPMVGFRADMDALWQEVDGEFRANHSCGHDAHMSVAMGAVLALKRMTRPRGTLRFIFQPAEEKGTGALKMLEKGAVDDLAYLFGIHLRPQKELAKGLASAAIRHGAARFYRGRVEGQAAHAAWPHAGVNAIEAGFAFAQALQGVHLPPIVPHSVKVTRFQAGGESANVIPGSAEFALDLRAQTNEVMDELVAKVERAAEATAKLHGAGIVLERESWIVAARVDAQAQGLMRQSIAAVLGERNARDLVSTPGGEDFHFYAYRRPGLKSTMLGLGCGLEPGLHHPRMTFDREALMDGVAIVADVLIRALEAAA